MARVRAVAAGLGSTAAAAAEEVGTWAAPLPIAMIWPWALSSSWGDMVCTCRPCGCNAAGVALPAREAGFNSMGKVPITCHTEKEREKRLVM